MGNLNESIWCILASFVCEIDVEEINNFPDDLNDKNNLIVHNACQNDDHEDLLESIMYCILNEFPNQKVL